MHSGVAQGSRRAVPKEIPAGFVTGQVWIPLIGHLITTHHITQGAITVGRMEDLMVADTMVVLTAEDLTGVEGIIEAGV